jgi:hypothetical protein
MLIIRVAFKECLAKGRNNESRYRLALSNSILVILFVIKEPM